MTIPILNNKQQNIKIKQISIAHKSGPKRLRTLNAHKNKTFPMQIRSFSLDKGHVDDKLQWPY